MSNTSMKRNISLSIIVQIVSVCVSFVLSLIVPKYISELQYSYWQSYVLYVGYVGILHFGLLDGIVLRYSQYDYEQLDKPRIRSQFQALFFFNIGISLLAMIVAVTMFSNHNKYILIFVAIGVVSKNAFTYTSYSFQITNRIGKYAVLVLSQRLSYGLITIMLLIFRVKSFYLYCIADLCGDLFGCVIGYYYNKDLYFGKTIGFHKAIQEIFANTTSGVKLLIANWSSMLLVGSAKMIVQWRWDDLTFGKISFSFSISNLFLTFVSAISVVLFPSLKRLEQSQLPNLYFRIRRIISPLLFSAIILYYPGCWILDLWLPSYHSSLEYLGLLLPIVIYSSKVSLLTNNYLKAYREENKMLWINIVSVIVAIGLFTMSAYLFNSLLMVLISIVLIIMIRSIVSEYIVMKLIDGTLLKEYFIEGVMTVVFVICAKSMTKLLGFIVYALFLMVYLFFYRNALKSLFLGVLRRTK